MADALHFAYSPGRLGCREGSPGLVLQELTQFALASVIARKGQAAQVVDAAQRTYGVAAPSSPTIAASNDLTFVWSGPNQWLALGPQAEEAVEEVTEAVSFNTEPGEASNVGGTLAKGLLKVLGY